MPVFSTNQKVIPVNTPVPLNTIIGSETAIGSEPVKASAEIKPLNRPNKTDSGNFIEARKKNNNRYTGNAQTSALSSGTYTGC